MRTMLAPLAAFAFASVLLLGFLLLLGVPQLIATIVTLGIMAISASGFGWRAITWNAAGFAIFLTIGGVFFFALGYPVLAADGAPDTTVHVAWGDIIGQIGVDLLPWAGLALLTMIIGLLPAPVRAVIQKFRTAAVDQLLERALGYAAMRLQDQLKGQELTLDVHSRLVKEAADYALEHGSKVVLDFAGERGLPEKLSARVLTSPSVQAARGAISPAFASAAAK
jgi:hypothetical protein